MTQATATRQINALILDDSVMTRKMIMKDLQATELADFTFTEADDGVDGLEKFTPGTYDIIFVDMQMPRMDGIDFLQELHKQHESYPPAVMITSERSMDILEQAVDAGVKAFMLKPVDKGRLTRGLRKLIDSLPDRQGPSAVPYGDVVPSSFQQMLSQAADIEIVPEAEDVSVRNGRIVFGSIAILGEVQWSVVLGFEQQAAVGIIEKFVGMEIPFDSPDMGDAVAELVNIVAGEIKRQLDVRGVPVEISLPVVNAAESLRTIAQRSTTCEHQHFHCESGKCWTSVTVGMNPGLVL
jgi:two-component system chemotaxis response regulator CheY